MTNWYCDSKCRIISGGAGPWDDQENFSNIRNAHKNCSGFQIGEQKLRGKTNWSHTEIEKEATEFVNQNMDRWFHELVASLKGPEKICLIKDKLKWGNQA